MLASARVALYPVYARGVAPYDLYQAQTQLNPSISNNIQMMSTTHDAMAGDDMQRNAAHATMDRLAEETGGKAFFPFKVEDLEQSFENIANELRHQYNIAYRPDPLKTDGLFHLVDLRVKNRKDLVVHVRKGYYALKM